MMMSCSNQILFVVLVASLACLCQVWAIDCVVCQNCAEPKLDANSTRACGKKEDRCIKMILLNDEVDRGCGDAAKCTGRAPTRKPRSLSKPKSKPEELTNYAPKQRTIRQLLAPPSNGGDGKTPTVEIAAMFCCEGDGCNSAPNVQVNYHHLLLLVLFSSSIYSICSQLFQWNI